MPDDAPDCDAQAGAGLDAVAEVVIIGPGLLGASVGLGLRAAGWAGRITGVARSAATLDAAAAVGAIDGGFDDPEPALANLSGPSLVIVAVPLSGFAAVFKKIAPHQRRGLVTTDLGSVKAPAAAEAKRHLAQPQFYVPAHPMAGSEKSGPAAATAGLFRGRPCVLCPDDATDAGALARVAALFERLGGEVVTMTAAEHDARVAAVSHLPHLASVLIAQTAAAMGAAAGSAGPPDGRGAQPLQLASTGFRGATRLALSNPPMRRDIVLANRERIGEALDRFAKQLNQLRGEIRKGDHDALLARLEEAQGIRASVEGD
ncbi:prephenate dehydrogenase [Phycisphaera mikurensis]|uniref:Prephenate dehydrogenase n=1 Tax=Phycisphaera mikurensis (strain NBRC 102666 / KCTC 22515 / FYK2301M01) TaxID=1142394 RepID=I0IBV2_PHYMF|nr:prephenate dehydrogenase/arogenate dehydrogenase family protein [Phycisphaera mikurensis]MBB6442033.1 prephenate dehydrogenase [Phycisphaera mikurensis]BAM02740.1 prephenate dehydrogenase [Phycisphaera mikurensis NBRC 102666]